MAVWLRLEQHSGSTWKPLLNGAFVAVLDTRQSHRLVDLGDLITALREQQRDQYRIGGPEKRTSTQSKKNEAGFYQISDAYMLKLRGALARDCSEIIWTG